MQDKFRKIFSNKKFLKTCAVIAIVFSLIQVIMCSIAGNYYLGFEMVIAAIALICVLIAIDKKPEAVNLPVAAAMMLYLLRYAERFFTYLSYPQVSVGRLVLIAVLPILMAIMMLIHLAMHLASDYCKLIKVQQVLYIIVVVFGAIARINGAIKAAGAYNTVSYIVAGLALVFTYLTLCAAEVEQ